VVWELFGQPAGKFFDSLVLVITLAPDSGADGNTVFDRAAVSPDSAVRCAVCGHARSLASARETDSTAQSSLDC
jgi:hypothetical protein